MDPIITAKQEDLIALARQHGVQSIKLFGSRASGTSHVRSDIDLLVSFAEQASWRDHVRFREAVNHLFGQHVDVATPHTLHWAMRDKVLQSAEAVWTIESATAT